MQKSLEIWKKSSTFAGSNYTIMNATQLQALSTTLQINFLMPNCSKLASALGYSGRMILSRVQEGHIGAKAFDHLWEDIKNAFDIDDEMLLRIPELWELSEQMAKVVKKEQFVAMVQHRHMNELPKDIRARLDALYKESYQVYSYALALFYAKVSDCNPNLQKGSLAIEETIQQVDAELYKHYKEEYAAHKVAMDLMTLVEELHSKGWFELMHSVGTLICYYTHPLYLEERVANDFKPMPFGEVSYWTEQDADNEHTTIWLLDQYNEDSGVYNVLQIKADSAAAVDATRCVFQRWGFFQAEDTMRCAIPQNIKMLNSAYYEVEWDEETEHLMLSFMKERSSKKPIVLPETLVKITDESPWQEWIESNEDDIYAALNTKMYAAFELIDTDWEVTDVTQSRQSLTIHAKNEQEKKIFTIDMDQYPSLKHITPWDEVGIFKMPDNGKLCAYWLESGIKIVV